jgi:predicted DsbA family dithiol-disulfide isomerase
MPANNLSPDSLGSPDGGDLTVWSDVVCPYCYFASPALDETAKRLGLRVVYRPFELHPGIPPEGAPKPFPDSAWPERQARFIKIAQSVGLPMNPRRDNRNSRLALETQELVRDRQGEEAAAGFHRAIASRFFVDHADISDVALVGSVAASFGVPADDVAEAWLRRDYRSSVDRSMAEAHRLGLQGVPSYKAPGTNLASGFGSADAMLKNLMIELPVAPRRA